MLIFDERDIHIAPPRDLNGEFLEEFNSRVRIGKHFGPQFIFYCHPNDRPSWLARRVLRWLGIHWEIIND